MAVKFLQIWCNGKRSSGLPVKVAESVPLAIGSAQLYWVTSREKPKQAWYAFKKAIV